MAALPSMVDIDCPRPGCETRIAVPLEITTEPPKPGSKTLPVNVRVVREELSNRMAEHYRDAHPSGVTVSTITFEGPMVGEKVVVRPDVAATPTRTVLEGSLADLIGADLPEHLDGLYVAPTLGVNFSEPFKVDSGDGKAKPSDV